MVRKVCGNCNFQRDSRIEGEGPRTYCLFDNQWHQDTDTCGNWREYSYNMSQEERLTIATSLRNSEEAELRHQESSRSSRRDRGLKIIEIVILFLVATGIISGIFKTLRTLISKWFNSIGK